MLGAAAAAPTLDAASSRCSGRRTRQGRAQVPFAEDQHLIGDLGAYGQHQAFGEAVRARTPRRDLDHRDARIGQDLVERCLELPDSITEEEPEPGGVFAEVHDEVADLLGGPGSVGLCGHAQHVQVSSQATPTVA
jgi:hypothetical protein